MSLVFESIRDDKLLAYFSANHHRSWQHIYVRDSLWYGCIRWWYAKHLTIVAYIRGYVSLACRRLTTDWFECCRSSQATQRDDVYSPVWRVEYHERTFHPRWTRAISSIRPNWWSSFRQFSMFSLNGQEISTMMITHLGDGITEIRIAQHQPTTRRDTVGLVLKFLRWQFVERFESEREDGKILQFKEWKTWWQTYKVVFNNSEWIFATPLTAWDPWKRSHRRGDSRGLFWLTTMAK